MIKERGADGKLKLEFAGLDVFGTPENTRVIFMKLKESGSQYEKHELQHIHFDYKN